MHPWYYARSAKRLAHASAVAILLPVLFVGGSGCRANQEDLRRWEDTVHGPEKIRAVLTHDKYDVKLRTEAALALVRMKPRAGRHIGVSMLGESLAQVQGQARESILSGLVAGLVAELSKPPPAGQAGQPAPADASYAFKDAAFSLLSAKEPVLITDPALQANLKSALVSWAMADFEHRFDNRSQTYGMDQVFQYIGPEAATGLPALMTKGARKLDALTGIVVSVGDAKTKEAASAALVRVASYVNSPEWTAAKKPELEAANAASKLQPTEKQFQAQLAQYQEEELQRVFTSMRRLGGRPAVDWLLAFAANTSETEKKRQLALAALEMRLDKGNPDDIRRILEIATRDAPDAVLDQVLRRLGELPREQAVPKLYELFATDKWKVRRAAASALLRLSTGKDLEEFMSKLASATKDFGMSEALTYGTLFAELKDLKPAEALRRWLGKAPIPVRTSAISYYYASGTPADLPALEPLAKDGTRIPACERDPECKWACETVAEGAQVKETKELKTVGEYVKYCVLPAVRARTTAAR